MLSRYLGVNGIEVTQASLNHIRLVTTTIARVVIGEHSQLQVKGTVLVDRNVLITIPLPVMELNHATGSMNREKVQLNEDTKINDHSE